MASKLNVLVYSGSGTSIESVKQCLYTLRCLLSPTYAVIPIAERPLLHEPWPATCALLVFPGGADLGYCRVFNGEGNRKIDQYVRRGGAFMGFCAGGYYATRKCEFAVDDDNLRVVGSRELGFFPGSCRGPVFRGFDYTSESGAHASKLTIHVAHLASSEQKQTNGDNGPACAAEVYAYTNGGGAFVVEGESWNTSNQDIQILASYAEDIDVDAPEKAAVVYCKVGRGAAIVTGPHIEFTPSNLTGNDTSEQYQKIIQTLIDNDDGRVSFLQASLRKLGLEVNEQANGIPTLTTLHLTSIQPEHVSQVMSDLQDLIIVDEGKRVLKGEADTFVIASDRNSEWSVSNAVGDAEESKVVDAMTDSASLPKTILPHASAYPDRQGTPYFHHDVFYQYLGEYRQSMKSASQSFTWGSYLLYGEVITSTNSIIDKNYQLLSKLPTGFTVTATTQIAARGRGSNVWISPPGSLAFSTVINHPSTALSSRPIVFLQYLASIAIVDGILAYGSGYGELPIKIKWPNDVYALHPLTNLYTKISGILTTCSYHEGSYQLVMGIGVNANNKRPTISLAEIVALHNKNRREGRVHTENETPETILLPDVRNERLLASILVHFEAYYRAFLAHGFTSDMEARYYQHWLHANQSVTLEAESIGRTTNMKARIRGITRDWGLLQAEAVDDAGRPTGEIITLQSDENSFDFWKGLVRKKT